MGSSSRWSPDTITMKLTLAVLASVLAIAMAAPAAEAEPEPKNVGTKHFGGYGYGGYPLLGAGYHYPSHGSYGHFPSYGSYGSYGHYSGGYRPCYGYACILRNKNKN